MNTARYPKDRPDYREQTDLLERMHELARIGTWEVDLINNKLWWSAMTKRIHEVGPEYAPDLKSAINFYREGASRRIINEALARAIEDDKPFDVELQLVTANGQNIWVRAIGQPVCQDGVCQRVHGMFQDIDERRKGEERQLDFAILEAKAKEMEQFAYAASHELREPLLTIAGYVDVIREDYADDLPTDARGHLDTIAGAAGRMDELIAGLLDYSRLSAAKQLQSVDFQALLDQISNDLSVVIQQSDTRLNYRDLPTANGYPLELKILLTNLIGNAIKYRRPEIAPEITIAARRSAEGTHFTVADNGIGIPRHQLENIFQLFRQLHTGGASAGSGIGLANCKKIVELHRGTIHATSTVGEGTTFHFTLNL